MTRGFAFPLTSAPKPPTAGWMQHQRRSNRLPTGERPRRKSDSALEPAEGRQLPDRAWRHFFMCPRRWPSIRNSPGGSLAG